MAILGTTTLIGCNSIPQFIGTGTTMVFHQTNAPTSWTKRTEADFNDIALRVIGGPDNTSFSPRVGTGFTSVFIAAKGLTTVPLNVNPAAITIENTSGYLTTQASGSAASISLTPSTTTNLRAHTHPYALCPTTLTGADGVAQPQRAPAGTALVPVTSGPGTGQNGQHNHGVTDGQHNHPISPGIHNHDVSDPGHTHIFTMTQRDFALTYVDVILCTKQ